MSDRPKRIKAPEGPPPARVIADAIDRVTEAIRESFGPRQEVRLMTDEAPSLLGQIRPLVVEATNEEMDNPLAVRGLAREALKRRIREDVLTYCGFEDGAEVTADGSADNDLAQERADEIMALMDFVRGSGYPGIVRPVIAPATVEQVKQTIRHLLLKITKNDDDAKPTRAQLERTDVIESFISLARTHPDPRRLMPRGDRTGDWLPPGTRVTVLGQHPGVVEPELDMVRVKLDAVSTATSFPRNSIVKEGEEWTPPKPTA